MKLNKKIHIICFDVPYPPTYGGVIDVFYKIKALADNGVEVYLHVFYYGRKQQDVLNKYCKEVHYYKRNTTWINALGLMPYIVKSRKSEALSKNLERVKAPILFEGLHTTFLLKNKRFKDRKLFVRTHNIEHLYYKQLSKNESNVFKKLFYSFEAVKLKYYEKNLKHSNAILSLSKNETAYFEKKFGEKVMYLPAFHPSEGYHELSKKGYFALYHGNLSVTDNMKAALLLIDAFKPLDYPLVIAGQTSDKKFHSKIDQHKNISFIELKDEAHLFELLNRAHVNVLYSSNNSGLKLKLINALFQSRYVIANNNMADGSGLESLCKIANNKAEIINQLLKITEKDFPDEDIAARKDLLKLYDKNVNVQMLIQEL